MRVQDARVDERERQRASRSRRRAAPASGCHEQASESKPVELVGKLLESWDNAVAVSRAGFRRDLAAILRRSTRKFAASPSAEAALSRAGFRA
jgi:hypothetical protein